MALSATIYHLKIDLTDTDRGVYESLDLRLARHPSETMHYLLARTIAYCLCYEEGIAFSRGLAEGDEPAIWVHDLQGALRVWIEVGTPAAERLHKASKASPRVVVFTHNDPGLLARATAGKTIHRAEDIEVYSLAPAFLDELEGIMDRSARWEMVHTGGELYVTAAGRTLTGTVTRHGLGE